MNSPPLPANNTQEFSIMSASSPTAAAIPTSTASVKNLPVNLFASVMGLAGLTQAWRGATSVFGASAAIANGIGVVSVLVFLAVGLGYLAKWTKFPQAVRDEFTHPVLGNFFGTVTIAVLLLSSVIAPWSVPLQKFVWSVGAIATLVLSYIVVARVMQGKMAANNVVPAWLIPGVASLDIAVTGATMPMAWAPQVNLIALAVGTMVAIVFFTMIFSRLVHGDPLPTGMIPSLMVMIAPFEVGFLAYTNITHQVDMFSALLFWFGMFMTLVLGVRVFRPSVTFAPSWWAISFPLAALSNAALKYASVNDSTPLLVLAGLILAFLTIVIAVLFVRTLHSLFSGKLLSA
jgi:tellurite resistance protein